ncbi:ABC transporter permease [Streptomyces sp. NPDC048507]|uniref:ABC transporter permease n=1 Tax=Streptomyces sp. NPDC048507 TaxID=3365560 RepID=UPI00372067E8
MSGSRRTPLWWQLLRIGAAAGRAAPAGRVRFVALACGTLAASLALSAIMLVLAAYEGRDLRDAARSPVRSPQAAPAPLLYRPAFDAVDDQQYQVVYVLPLRDDAPLPPGVSAWPRPGQALLSPALLAAGRDEGIETRYGAVAGTIGAQGLASPGERFAYVRPDRVPADTSRMWPVARFGTPSPSGIGENLFVKPVRLLLVIAVFMAALPAAALAVSGARAGSDARDQRTALLGALGGGRRVRAVVNAGEAALPVAAGALPGLGVGLWLLAQDTRLPLVGYTLAVADTRRWAWAVAAAPLLAAALVLLAVVLTHPPQDRRQGPRPRLLRTRLPRWWPYLCPLMALLAVQGPALAPNPAARLLLYATGVGGTILTLPSLTGLAAVAAGHALARLGRRTGRPGALVCGRWAAAWPGATVRLTAGVVIAFVLVGQTQLWVTRTTGTVFQARQTVERVGTSALTVGAPDDGPVPPAFLAALPSGVEALRLSIDRGRATAELNGPCTALRRLSLPCTPQAVPVEPRTADVRVGELDRWDTPGQGLFARQSSDPKGDVIVLVGDPGRQISVPAVKEAANRHLGMAVPVGTIAGSWLNSATADDRQGLWVLLFGAFAVTVTALSAVLSNLAEYVRFSRRITALSVLSASRTLYLSTAFFSLFVPLLAASLIGLATHCWLATPMTTGEHADGASLSRPLLAAVLAAALAMALVVWLWGAHGAARLAHRWRPAAD